MDCWESWIVEKTGESGIEEDEGVNRGDDGGVGRRDGSTEPGAIFLAESEEVVAALPLWQWQWWEQVTMKRREGAIVVFVIVCREWIVVVIVVVVVVIVKVTVVGSRDM